MSSLVCALGCGTDGPLDPDPWSSYLDDVNVDGTFEHQAFATRNDQGLSERIELDLEMDGVIDSIWTYEHNGAGDLTLFEFDENADGIPNFQELSIYDARGDLVNWSRDNNLDGVNEVSELFHRDNAGQIEFSEYDGLDDEPDFDWRKDYVYEAGEIARIDFRRISSAVVVQAETFAYENGNVVLYESWREPGHELLVRIEYDFGDNGRLLQSRSDSDGDGRFDGGYSWTYDSEDRMKTLEYANEFGPVFSKSFSYED